MMEKNKNTSSTEKSDKSDEKVGGFKGLVQTVNAFLGIMPLDYIFAAFCSGFCMSSFLMLMTCSDTKYKELSFLVQINCGTLIIATVTIGLALIFCGIILKNNLVIPLSLFVSALLFGCSLTFCGSVLNNESAENIYMNIAVGFVMFFVVAWITKDNKLNFLDIKLPEKTEWIAAGIFLLLFTVFVSQASIARYSAYIAHNFDLGIFTQMFENMRTTGMANTTVERNVLMSHFGVHFSPFYYVLLPLYAIYPCPETLLVIQALFVGAGIIPVVLICKKLDLNATLTILCCCIYIFFPTLSNGCLYDFHENKFLTVLIMWTLYFIVSKRRIGIIILCLLVMSVKEDAAIYVMSIALYVFAHEKKYIDGSILFLLSIIYFVAATSIVNSLGDGIMTDRLSNYMPEGKDGFGAVIETCISDFGYLLSQVFTADKIMFMVWMLLPVGFAPFMSGKKSLLVLLIPMLVIDLMSNWQYQYDVKFQYTFGVAGLIVFMTILIISQSDSLRKNQIVLYSTAMCIIMCFSLFFPRAAAYIESDDNSKARTEQYDSLIAEIPNDVEISANGCYIPHMYNFKNLYQYPNVYGSENRKSDYLLVNQYDVTNNSDNLATFMGNEYELIKQKDSMCLYKHK